MYFRDSISQRENTTYNPNNMGIDYSLMMLGVAGICFSTGALVSPGIRNVRRYRSGRN